MLGASPPASPSPASVTRSEAFFFWLKLGLISFGGPAGQIALMHEELVEKRRWISERRFLHALNFCMLLPGPEAQQLATYIGWLMHKRCGGLMAGGLFVLPSLLILIALSWLYMVYGQLPLVMAFMSGIKPAVVAIVLFAAWRIARRTLHSRWLIAIAVSALLAVAVLHLPFPAIILGAAVTGLLLGKYRPEAVAHKQAHALNAHASAAHSPALIDDDTPAPPHVTRASSLRILLTTLSAGSVLVIGLLSLLLWRFGWDHTLSHMALFFTKAALLTFGGAYAVLPYVVEHAVHQYHWLTSAQMLDGLALGETTPGPLIIIVSYVGFVGGWTQALFGPDHLLAAGITAACVATLFTFLPSFIFIFAGAPWIESSRHNLHLQAPLTAISAAVVGVIINLGIYFGRQVFFPQGFIGTAAGTPDWSALLIFCVIAAAMWRTQWSLLFLIPASGLLGLALSWLH